MAHGGGREDEIKRLEMSSLSGGRRADGDAVSRSGSSMSSSSGSSMSSSSENSSRRRSRGRRREAVSVSLHWGGAV
ncbi:hypothetical protein CLOM_g1355 [Closterium sp. NIES-68]|nr:hypothetical protein CLOM_g1355 [Closterium sp. NIES-68]